MCPRLCFIITIITVSLWSDLIPTLQCGAESIRVPNVGMLNLQKPPQHHQSFIDGEYAVKSEQKAKFRIRQVPGDGGCLFHAISAWLSFLESGSHLDFDWRMRKLSQHLRHIAIKVLSKPNTTLVLENGEVMESTALLGMISDVYGLQPSEYCEKVLDPRTWGGGPEIVALSNHFRCPIHVYQLCSDRNLVNVFWKTGFQLELCAKFGSPTFDSKAPICLLCADGRFPNISPGSQRAVGDHFLAMFPVSPSTHAAATSQNEEQFPYMSHSSLADITEGQCIPAESSESESVVRGGCGVGISDSTDAKRCRRSSSCASMSGNIRSLRIGNWLGCGIGLGLKRLLIRPFSSSCNSVGTRTERHSSNNNIKRNNKDGESDQVCLLNNCPEMRKDYTYRDWVRKRLQ